MATPILCRGCNQVHDPLLPCPKVGDVLASFKLQAKKMGYMLVKMKPKPERAEYMRAWRARQKEAK